MEDPEQRAGVLADLSRLAWTKGVSEEALEEIVAACEFIETAEQDVIIRSGDTLTGVYFITRGRVWATVRDIFGKTVLERALVRGSCFGLFSVAQPDDVRADITSMEPSTLLKLPFDALHELSAKHRAFQMNLYRLASEQVRQIVLVDRKPEQPSVVAIVHQSPESRPLAHKILSRLSEIEQTPCVASDASSWPDDNVKYRSLTTDGRLLSKEESRKQLKEWANFGRVFVDISAQHNLEELGKAMSFADTVLWCVRPSEAPAAKKLIKQLHERVSGWRDKICLVWMLKSGDYVAPYMPELTSLVDRTFKLSDNPPVPNQGNLLSAGIERIIHYLRGIRIGIALGGGAARGMAHLGVLKALEQNGIHIDMLAGTSAGAMTGILYAYGMDVDYNVDCFINDLRLPWFYRRLPAGGYWYLLSKYRRGKFDPMLRKYLGDSRLDQLAIPAYSVTVDLVSGGPVVREKTDAVGSILESINLPGLSSPILHEREALVDGGLVNNIPADVLVSKGCNFVIASSVTAKLEREFSGISADGGKHGKRRNPSTLQVLLRGHLVQSRNMTAVGVQPADFVIAPDVTAFDLSAFDKTDEMAEVGEKTTLESIQQIKQMLSKLDDKLFSW